MTPPSPLPPAAPSVPQVLLFGHSGAGKSALLGALFQAGEKQGETLGGEVLEVTGRLASLRDAAYRGTPLERTHTELVSYLIRLRPPRAGGHPVGDAVSVLLHDCSGKAAESLIRHPAAIDDPETRAPVARAVLEADAILLLVDAAADEKQLHAAFAAFDDFLTAVGAGKAGARAVGGFPVYLVLTQCDRLARPYDSRAAWAKRIDTRAEYAWNAFDDYLKHASHEGEEQSPFLPFGSIHVVVEAVAVRQPRLVDAAGQPATPYRVAELFRDCFAAAAAHRQRVRGSNRRLAWTVWSSVGFVAALVLAAAGVVLFQPPQIDTQLADRVLGYQMREPPPAVRLAEPNLTRDKHILLGFRDNPGFWALSEDLRDFIDSRLREIDSYERYRAKLLAATAPGDCRSLEELAAVEKSLHGELAWPAEYGWEETPAGKLREKWLEDARAIRTAESAFFEYYRNFVRRGLQLTLTPSFGGAWRTDVNGLFADAIRPPAALGDPLPGSPVLALPRGEAVPNRVPFEFDRVYQARTEWEATRDRLGRLRDLADALGLTAGTDLPPPVLVLPEPGPGVNPATLPGARWTALVRNYPALSDDFREWSLGNFPDPGRSILAERLERSYRTGVQTVQGLIRARLDVAGKPNDTPESWRALAGVLLEAATPFPEWGRLLTLYVKLRSPAAPNPVLELASFLRQPSFVFDLPEFKLEIPADLSLEKVVPAGPLAVTVAHPGSPSATVRLASAGDGVRESSLTTYRLTATGTAKLTYIPGDGLRAELPVRAGTQELKLVWETSGSRTYPFDLFAREPRLVKPGGVSEPAVGVKLAPAPTATVPHLPALFPALSR